MKAKNEPRKKSREGEIQSLIFLGIGVLLMIYSLYNHSHANIDWIMSPYLFPLLISVFLILLSISLALEIRKTDRKENTAPEGIGNINRRKLLISIAAIFLYYIAMPYIGFLLSSIVFLTAMLWMMGERRWRMILLLSVGTSFILYGIFHELLNVMLP